MKAKLYHFLVSRQPGIRMRYHQFHDHAHGFKKVISWFYLFWLNFAFYILQCRFLGKTKGTALYEKKRLQWKQSESDLASKQIGITENFVNQLLQYDVISFDMFDTLIFRPFSEPSDLFYFIGEQLGVMNFKELRKQAEKKAREACFAKNGHYEVTLQEIWEQLQVEVGISAVVGIQAEIQFEKNFCYANAFMADVFERLKKCGKKIIVVSDMYLPEMVLDEILQVNGYIGYEKLYVSCKYKKNKENGSLFQLVRSEHLGNIVHIGDNLHSDVSMAKKCGIDSLYYPNVNVKGNKYRPQDMSPIIGGAYRGLVNAYLYGGNTKFSLEQEYGFIYGGLFVTGYCAFIHAYCQKNYVDKILFLSRDGDILKQAYEILFPEEMPEYVYWSRRVATKLMAGENKHDYFRRFLYHRINQGILLEQILETMELGRLVNDLPEELKRNSVLTDKNVDKVRKFLENHWAEVLRGYEQEQKVAERYYREVLFYCKKVVAVDIGWAGSGAIALNHLVQKVWQIPCEIVGLIAGTNTIHNVESEASETFLQSGKLEAYLYSQSFNRDLMKKHDLNKNFNMYWELLLSSPTPQFIGFSESREKGGKFCFGKCDANLEGIYKIQEGILAFVKEYKRQFGDFPFMYNISGRDAYAPMLLAASNGEKYLKKMEQRFAFDINVS